MAELVEEDAEEERDDEDDVAQGGGGAGLDVGTVGDPREQEQEGHVDLHLRAGDPSDRVRPPHRGAPSSLPRRLRGVQKDIPAGGDGRDSGR